MLTVASGNNPPAPRIARAILSNSKAATPIDEFIGAQLLGPAQVQVSRRRRVP